MGKIAYNFLADSFFFSEKVLADDFKEIDDKEIHRELSSYRKFILDNQESLLDEVSGNKSTLKVFSTIDRIPEKMLLQSALYVEQFVIDDPLFKLTRGEDSQSNEMGQYLGFKSNEVDKPGLARTLRFLKSVVPMIAADFLKIIPVSFLFEPQKQTPIYYSENHFEDVLPKELSQYFKEQASVRSMEELQGNRGWRMLENNDFTPGLFIGFGDDPRENGMMFHYMKTETINIEGRKMTTAMQLADYPVNPIEWEYWVKQSINRTAINITNQLYQEVSLASALGSTYMTDNSFKSGLITKGFGGQQTPETVTVDNVINLNLPFIDRIDVQKLMDLRTFEADTFTNFRMELEQQFKELKLVADSRELEERRTSIMHDLGVIGVKRLGTKMNSLKKKSFIDGALMVAGLAGTVASGGWSLLAAATAAASGYKSYVDYKEAIKESPSYLFWKVLK